ncbi:MAG: hypothetical protein WBE64_03815, partial [Xanthobacteraceae bacterium]
GAGPAAACPASHQRLETYEPKIGLMFCRRDLETKMRTLVTALVCIAALYVVDVIWFNGQLFAAAAGMMSQIISHFR